MAAPDPGDVPEGAEDPRLASLDDRLRAAHKAEEARTAPEHHAGFGLGGKGALQGQRVLRTLVGYPLGGGVIGWLIDGWLDTRPWWMLGLMFAAFAAACWEIYRISRERPE